MRSLDTLHTIYFSKDTYMYRHISLNHNLIIPEDYVRTFQYQLLGLRIYDLAFGV